MTQERQTEITPEDPGYERPSDEELRETEIDDEPLGVPAEGDSSVNDQPGIPDGGEPPASA